MKVRNPFRKQNRPTVEPFPFKDKANLGRFLGQVAAGVLEGNFAQLPIQAYGVLCTLVWSGAVSFVLMVLLRLTIGVRVPEAAEVEGLDLALHGETVQ